MTDLIIRRGKTLSQLVRWETEPLVYVPITAITQAGPVVITAAAHGLVNGWNVAVVSAGGMRQINSRNWPLRSGDFHKATVLTADSITLNDVNSSGFNAYTSGGSLVYFTQQSLAGYTARMQIRATAEAVDPALVSLVSPTDIAIDDTAQTITITIAAAVTAAYAFGSGVYDLELVSPAGVVTQLLSGDVTVIDEVTR